MNVTIVLRSADATQWSEPDAFAALSEASAAYPDWAFRLRSGSEAGLFRLEAFKIAGTSTGWLRVEA